MCAEEESNIAELDVGERNSGENGKKVCEVKSGEAGHAAKQIGEEEKTLACVAFHRTDQKNSRKKSGPAAKKRSSSISLSPSLSNFFFDRHKRQSDFGRRKEEEGRERKSGAEDFTLPSPLQTPLSPAATSTPARPASKSQLTREASRSVLDPADVREKKGERECGCRNHTVHRRMNERTSDGRRSSVRTHVLVPYV